MPACGSSAKRVPCPVAATLGLPLWPLTSRPQLEVLREEGFWEVSRLPPPLPLWVAVRFPTDGSAVAAFIELTFSLTKGDDAFWKLHLVIFWTPQQ